MVARLLVCALIIGCGGKKKPAGEDATRAARDATIATPDTAGSGAGSAATGDAAVRVEWKAVPTTARQSPGRTACNTARAPAVSPTTLWGIPDALVLTDKAPAPTEARIVLADCALVPRLAIASTLLIVSAVDRPARLTLTKHGTTAKLAALQPAEPRAIQLPIAGHAVSLELEPNGVYRLAIDAPDGEAAWIVNAPGAVTDAAGVATLRLPVGTHDVTAWLPARGGRDARLVTSKLTVDDKQLAELALDLGSR